MGAFRTKGDRAVDAVSWMVLVPVVLQTCVALDARLHAWTFAHLFFNLATCLAVLRAGASFLFLLFSMAQGGETYRDEAVSLLRPICGPKARWVVAALLTGLWILCFSTQTWLTSVGLAALPFIGFGYARIVGESAERLRPITGRVEMRWSPLATRKPWLRFAILCTILALLPLSARTTYYLWPLWFVFWASWITARAELGSDGVYISGFRPRFIPFSPAATFDWDDSGVNLEQNGERTMRFSFRSCDDSRRDAIANHVRALSAHTTTRTLPNDERVASLAVAMQGPADGLSYRAAPVAREDLWRIAELGWVAPRVRVKAIRDLLADEEPGDRGRIDAMADANADPEMRARMRRYGGA